MNPANPLDQLRAAHMPAEFGWWPPAPGWWLLALIIIVLLVVLVSRWQRRRRALAYKRDAHQQLKLVLDQHQQQPDAHLLLDKIGELLRRTCISRYGRETVAPLTGEDWLAFLDRTGNTQEFSQGVGRVLISERYSKAPNIDAQQLIAVTTRWLERQR